MSKKTAQGNRALAEIKLLSAGYKSFFTWLIHPPFPRRELRRQILDGFNHFAFTAMWGAVVQALLLSWISGYYGGFFGATKWLGTGTTEIILRESSVLMTAVLFACKTGTRFTVEISSMSMSGQTDALKLMDVEPVQYLIIPRVLASALVMPVFTGLSHGIAIGATALVLKWWFSFPLAGFSETAFLFLKTSILTSSLIRASVIGFAVALNACIYGSYYCESAGEMGKITTRALVLNIFMIFVIDLLINILFAQAGLVI
jgi:phospholipid/cholesterol/gamma-HCH transport system permease protein